MLAQANIKALPIADNSIDMIFTDPPYHKKNLYCYEWLAIEASRVLKLGGFVAAMAGGAYKNDIFRYFDNAGLNYYFDFQNGMTGGQAGIVWKHSKSGNMPISIRSKSIIAYTKGTTVSRTAMCQWYDGNGRDKFSHVWGQDVDSARYYIDCLSYKNDIILDPFVGGGTSYKACKLIGRRFVGFDIDVVGALSITKDIIEGVVRYDSLPIFSGVTRV